MNSSKYELGTDSISAAKRGNGQMIKNVTWKEIAWKTSIKKLWKIYSIP